MSEVNEIKLPKRMVIDVIPYLSEIMGKGLIKDMGENQIICETCKGTGLALEHNPYGIKGDKSKNEMFPYKQQTIVSCQSCVNGLINLCEYCKKPQKRFYNSCDCDTFKAIKHEKEKQKEIELYEKSTKLKHDDEKANDFKMFYSEYYGYNEGYFSDFDEFFEYWEDNEEDLESIDRPLYVWGTSETTLSMDVDSILENAASDLHEEAVSNIINVDIKELDEYLTNWCKKQENATTTYCSDCTYSIEIPWHLYDEDSE